VDLILSGGSVFTADRDMRVAEAVGIREGRIAAVGSTAEVMAAAGPETRVLELEGRTVVPGFQDAHVHAPHGGLAKTECYLYESRSAEESLAIVARYAADHPDREWISGGGWSIEHLPTGTPSRADLDAVCPDRPVFLDNADGHTAWVNSRALELAGITGETPDPPDGRIERDADGEPQGCLHEGAADLVERLLPPPTQQQWENGILAAQAELHALGITAWQDADMPPTTLDAYRAVAERGGLTMRIEGNLQWVPDVPPEDAVEELAALRETAHIGRLRIRGAKLFVDGVLENFTGTLLEPYTGTDNVGIPMFGHDELTHIVTLLDGHGFQVHMHAIGDRAVRDALDAIEAAQLTSGVRDARHHLAHVQLVHPDDVQRFRELGVVANVSPLWACRSRHVTELTEPFIGPERSARMYPFGTLHRAGARLAFGSDWTVSTPNPLPQIEVAVTRVHPETRDEEPLLPAEALDLPTALATFTMGSAYVNFLDGETGTLEPGKLADLAVLDRDILDPGAGPVGDARVILTLVDGEAVHADPALGW
jgi:predicted amidohydrolase YtcJ